MPQEFSIRLVTLAGCARIKLAPPISYWD